MGRAASSCWRTDPGRRSTWPSRSCTGRSARTVRPRGSSASRAGEIMPEGHEFYDYSAKYLDVDGARLLIPAAISDEVLGRVQSMSVRAFVAIECAGMARVDFFLRGDHELWLNEINTIPGFTSISMYPKLWDASGLPYAELVERLLELAVERDEVARTKDSNVRELL